MGVTSFARVRMLCCCVIMQLLLAACGGHEDGSRADRPGTGTSASAPSVARDEPNRNGPGLLSTSTDSLKLPLARTADLSHVQPKYFALGLDRNPERIFEFVRDQIAFEPYDGCLRGPRGTLLAMAGNSVDRATLLASLLTNSGQRVRFAHGTLPESVARNLVASVWASRPPPMPANADTPTPDAKEELDNFAAAVARDGESLAKLLGGAGQPSKRVTGISREELISEARDHYWVEWWSDGKWIALDPLFADSMPGHEYVQSKETLDALPEALFHQIEMRIRIEESVGDGLASREVLQYATRAADLSGESVVLLHQRAQSDSGRQFRPVMIVGLDQLQGLAFWVTPPPVDTAGSLADAFGGFGGNDGSISATVAEFVDFRFIYPDGREETIVRTIFDRFGNTKRQQIGAEISGFGATGFPATHAEKLDGSAYDIFFTTGGIHSTHLVTLGTGASGSAMDANAPKAGIGTIGIAFQTISDGLLGYVEDAPGQIVRMYPDSPRVTVSELNLGTGYPRLTLDLRRNPTRTIVSGFRDEEVFIAQVLRSVVDGTIERSVIDYFANDSHKGETDASNAMSASLLFERAKAQQVSPVLMTRSNAPLRSQLPSDIRLRIDGLIADGQLVVAPDRPIEVGGKARFAWWQTDPISGATLAVTDEGLHQATAEGYITRSESGEYHFVVQHGDDFYAATARNSDEATQFAKNFTSNFAKDKVTVQWRGLVELWGDIFLGL